MVLGAHMQSLRLLSVLDPLENLYVHTWSMVLLLGVISVPGGGARLEDSILRRGLWGLQPGTNSVKSDTVECDS